MGDLYVVGTPIGNLNDISRRALETFRQVDIIAAEDTRHTLHLLTHFDIKKPLISCRAQNEKDAAQRIVGLLAQGKSAAFVSDAGTPGISDPGALLTDTVRKAGHRVIPIPGPCAAATLISVAGSGGKTVVFEGFLPRKHGAQKDRLVQLATIPATLVIYESPRRVAATLATISEVMPRRRLALVRELTKVHEEVIRGLAPELAATVAAREHLKGECVIVVSAPKEHEPEEGSKASKTSTSPSAEQTLADAIQAGLEAGERKSALAKRLSKSFSLDRDVVYEAILKAAHTS